MGEGAAVVGLAGALAMPAFDSAAAVIGGGVGVVLGRVLDRTVSEWAGRGAHVGAEMESLARAFVSRDVPPVVDAAVAAMDLTQRATRHIDLNLLAAMLDVDAVVARADLDAAITRVDIAAVLNRVDLNAIVDRLDLDAIAARIDLETIVKRVDPDTMIDRVDVDAALARLDLAAITRQIIDE